MAAATAPHPAGQQESWDLPVDVVDESEFSVDGQRVVVLERMGGGAGRFDTGELLWEAAVVLARWVSARRAGLRGRRVVELGAGCGMPGVTAALVAAPAHVELTDYDDATLANLRRNVEANAAPAASPTTVSVSRLDWTEPPPAAVGRFDVVLGADVCYRDHCVPALQTALTNVAAADCTALFVSPHNREGVDALAKRLAADGWEHTATRAPPEMLTNPYLDGDEMRFQANFFQFVRDEFWLHSFSRGGSAPSSPTPPEPASVPSPPEPADGPPTAADDDQTRE